MQAVKAIYKEGNVHLLTPILDVDDAELCVIVLDKNTQSDDIEQFVKTEWEYNMTANKPS